jgi:DNA-binding CsgD family transcriptional regulator
MQTYPPVRISALVVMALINMRKAEAGVLALLDEAKKLAFDTYEMQRLLPVVTALLEYEWLTGSTNMEQRELDDVIGLVKEADNVIDNSSFVYWLKKTRGQTIPGMELFEAYRMDSKASAAKAALVWQKLGCPYEQALALFEGTEDNKRMAVSMVHELGAIATCEKLKQLMRNSGIKSIPRGMRKSTQANPAHLTEREIDIIHLLKEGLQNKEIAGKLYISPKTVDHHISSLLFKLNVNSRAKAVQAAAKLGILK